MNIPEYFGNKVDFYPTSSGNSRRRILQGAHSTQSISKANVGINMLLIHLSRYYCLTSWRITDRIGLITWGRSLLNTINSLMQGRVGIKSPHGKIWWRQMLCANVTSSTTTRFTTITYKIIYYLNKIITGTFFNYLYW